MSKNTAPRTKLIDISIRQDGTLWIAGSSAIHGLIVTARSKEEALAKVPLAIKEMLDFSGGEWFVTECENPEAIGAQYAFAALPADVMKS